MKVLKSISLIIVFSAVFLPSFAQINASPSDIILLKGALAKTDNPDAIVPLALKQCESMGAKSVQDCLRIAEDRAKKTGGGCNCCNNSSKPYELGFSWGFMCWPVCSGWYCDSAKQ